MAKVSQKRKNLLFKTAMLLFTLYIALSLVQIQGKIQESRELLELLEQQNEEQRIANKELERILSDGTQEEYIERIARERLGFAYPKEQVLIDISGS